MYLHEQTAPQRYYFPSVLLSHPLPKETYSSFPQKPFPIVVLFSEYRLHVLEMFLPCCPVPTDVNELSNRRDFPRCLLLPPWSTTMDFSVPALREQVLLHLAPRTSVDSTQAHSQPSSPRNWSMRAGRIPLPLGSKSKSVRVWGCQEPHFPPWGESLAPVSLYFQAQTRGGSGERVS